MRLPNRRPQVPLDILMEPVGHIRIVDIPRLDKLLVMLPVVLVSIEEPKTMVLELVHGSTLEAALVPIVVLFSVAFPLIRGVDGRHLILLSVDRKPVRTRESHGPICPSIVSGTSIPRYRQVSSSPIW